MDRSLLIHVTVLLGLTALAVTSAPAAEPDSARQKDLIHLVRQDCGSCHGMTLAGGLGPALTRAALADKPLDSLEAVIEHGRPGTPMPSWRSMLRAGESRWIAERLLAGFPEESR